VLLLTPALVAALELGCRANDHRPSVVDDADLWAEQRSKAKGDAVVLLGASRIQLGFASDVFKERFPRRSLVHLAQNAQQPFATLRDLAEDEAFRGVVLCAARSETFSARHREDQALLVEHYHSHATLNGALNRRAATFFEERLVVRNPNARLDWMAAGLLRGEGLRGRAYIETRSDRSRSADYQVRGEAWLKAHRAERVERWRLAYTEPAPSPETWRADLAHAKPAWWSSCACRPPASSVSSTEGTARGTVSGT
jgi:hypothetical protein